MKKKVFTIMQKEDFLSLIYFDVNVGNAGKKRVNRWRCFDFVEIDDEY